MSKNQPDYTDAPMGCDVEDKCKDEGTKKLEVPVSKTFFLVQPNLYQCIQKSGRWLKYTWSSVHLYKLVSGIKREDSLSERPKFALLPKLHMLGQIT